MLDFYRFLLLVEMYVLFDVLEIHKWTLIQLAFGLVPTGFNICNESIIYLNAVHFCRLHTLFLFVCNKVWKVRVMTGAETEDDIPLGERKTVTDFCYLLDKSKQLFNGLRSVFTYLVVSCLLGCILWSSIYLQQWVVGNMQCAGVICKRIQPSIPRKYVYVGWLGRAWRMSSANAQCQCRKEYACYVREWKGAGWVCIMSDCHGLLQC